MNKNGIKTLGKLFLVALLVYFFLISIQMISVAFKGFGKGFAEALLNTTSNPFISLFVGILATSLIQSSSTTTSIVVGMVSSGVISIPHAVPIIMGANIGTTVTNSIVSLGHITHKEEFKRALAGATIHDFFNIMNVAILFTLNYFTGFLEKLSLFLAEEFTHIGGIKFTSPLKAITKPVVHMIKDFLLHTLNLHPKLTYILILILAAILTFASLFFIVRLMKSVFLSQTEAIFDKLLGSNAVLAIAGGALITAVVQSSSITTSLLVPMVGAGLLSLEMAFPITMGANIGTTITAILASFATGNVSAIAIAFCHFLFNFIGVFIFYPIKVLRQLPLAAARWLANLAYKNRLYAIIFVITQFFILPIALIFLSRLF